MEAQNAVLTSAVIQVFRFVEGNWLHKESSNQIFFYFIRAHRVLSYRLLYKYHDAKLLSCLQIAMKLQFFIWQKRRLNNEIDVIGLMLFLTIRKSLNAKLTATLAITLVSSLRHLLF